MSDDMLSEVCELAFEVAKEGGAPSAMKNYLYLAQRPPRAISVAQQALEEHAGFRERVAARATIDSVGEAGYLWLHRPAGWQQRFNELESGEAPVVAPSSGATTPVSERPPMPAPPGMAAPAQPPMRCRRACPDACRPGPAGSHPCCPGACHPCFLCPGSCIGRGASTRSSGGRRRRARSPRSQAHHRRRPPVRSQLLLVKEALTDRSKTNCRACVGWLTGSLTSVRMCGRRSANSKPSSRPDAPRTSKCPNG